MYTDNKNSYIVSKSAPLKQAMEAISANQKGAVIVIDDNNIVVGVLSDGDIRRALLKDSSLITPVGNIMNVNFIYYQDGSAQNPQQILDDYPEVTILPILSKENKLMDLIIREKKDKMWNYYQTKKREVFEGNRAKLQHIIDNIKQLKVNDAKVLNIWVGGGIFEDLALKQDLDVYSLDPDEQAIDRLRKKYSDVDDYSNKAMVGRIDNISFPDNYFDVVVVSEIFTLLSKEELDKALVEVKRALKSGGLLIGTVPARENLEESTACCPNCGNVFHRWGHVQSFTKSDVELKLAESFEVEKVYEKFFTVPNLNWKGKINYYLKWLFNLIGVKSGGNSIVFRAKSR